jgi:hypothetical protein
MYICDPDVYEALSNCVTEKIALENQPHDTIKQWRLHVDNIECQLVDKRRSKNHSLKLFRI